MDAVKPLITRSQVNKIIQLLLEFGVPPQELIFSQEIKGSFSIPLPLTVSIQNSNFRFTVGYFSSHTQNEYTAEFFPSERAHPQKTYHGDYEALVDEASWWAERVGKELSEPDPWILLGKGRLPHPELVDRIEENQKFNEGELQAIKKSLEKIRDFLAKDVNPEPRQFKAIEEQLDFLEEEAKKQGKKQWMYVAIGVVATIADGLVMSPDQAHKLFSFLSDLSKHLFMKLLP